MKEKEYQLAQPLQLQINAQSVMTSFCYGYSAALLKKLKELKAEGRIFQNAREAEDAEERSRKTGENCIAQITAIAASVIDALESQISTLRIDARASRPSKVDEGIMLVEEFLAIFDRKPEYSGGPENPAGD